MARIVKEEEYTARRNEILAAVRSLIYTRGFEQMSIQDVLDRVHISKGAFYHYFDSKQSLLEGITASMLDESEPFLLEIVRHPQMNAREKLQAFFTAASVWKNARKDFLMALMKTWYSDDNTVIRQKINAASLERFSPMLNEIILQGSAEGTLNPSFPEETGGVLLSLLMGLNDHFSNLFFKIRPHPSSPQRILVTFRAYNDAMERILGAEPGSLRLLDERMIQEWVTDLAAESKAESQ